MRNIHLSSMQVNILNLLLNSKTSLSSQYLANGLGASSKTIRKCIEDMQHYVRINGAEIEIKSGSGYRLIIKDEEAFDEFKQVEQIGIEIRNTFPIQEDRAHLVIRYLLTHKKTINIDDICDLVYMNRTSAKKILSKAREILAKFDLEVVFQAKKGLVIKGQEKDIRLCLVYEYSYFMTSYHYEGQDEYKNMIGINDIYIDQVENLVATLQNNFEEYNLSSYSIMYIARLIVVSKNRNASNHFLEIDDEISNHYSNRNTYFVAKMILNECEKLYETSFTAYDNILIAMCLVSFRVTLKEPEIFRFGYLKHKDIALGIVQYLFDINLFCTNRQDIHLIEDLSYNIEGLLEKYKYHIMTSQFRLIGYPKYSQMSRKMAVQIASYLKNNYNISLIPEDIVRLTLIIQPMFGRYPFAFSKYNACIITGIDKIEGKGLKERLLRNFDTFIQNIDIIETYEIKNIDLSKYKIIFSSCPKTQLPINDDIPFVYLSVYFGEKEKEEIRKRLIQVSSINSQQFTFSDYTKIYSNVNPISKEDCLNLISSKILKEQGSIELLEDLNECEEIMPSLAHENVVLLSGIKSHTDDISINIFVLDKPISWQQGVKTRIVVYWDRGKILENSQSFENEHLPHILDRFFANSEYVDDFIKNPTIETFEDIIQKIDGQVMTNAISFQ